MLLHILFSTRVVEPMVEQWELDGADAGTKSFLSPGGARVSRGDEGCRRVSIPLSQYLWRNHTIAAARPKMGQRRRGLASDEEKG